MTIIIHFLLSCLGTIAFGVVSNVPRQALFCSGLTGGVGWVCYYLLMNHEFGLATSNFFATFLMGCISIYFSRKLKIPVIIFNIPSLVPLVPGGPAYKAARDFVVGNNYGAFENLMVVLVTAGSIAGAFIMTSLVEQIYHKRRLKRLNKKETRHIR
ncbi:MAG TPA: threonine/serine exporter family protein [Candidatus Tetragenococcus pullicola]|nr:threonine/serine exporter family protein [Candidatus Tetragenococcus pullicola]